ncbi:hypothetical protein HJG53_14890 [Sphingomonas sp. ID1715]|uniref:hypothetical protein n=1 Tax=Sphingomonas sp. ID1715 TaxID=1656898 RepID=UPI001489DE42|nr:hypothetical protein [Sphingomonas sp. ID1715]NNM78177.1 hypothetical protein [Sphingomonas sp. ID1715]
MATAFFSALAKVPWAQVIDLAPGLVDKAQQLARDVRGGSTTLLIPAQPDPLAGLKSEVTRLIEDNADLRRDLGQASELLTELARTNQLLVAKLTYWQRLFWFVAGGAGLALLIAIAALARSF